jgi:multimeric flavodoxin WrbA
MGLVYEAWEAASRIVVSSPIFFYDIPSQGKAILDRSQAFWVRRYRLGRGKGTKPGAKGFLLAVGATKGEQLFVPITLAVRYLFDAISFPKGFGTLFFRGIEGPSDLSLGQLGEARDAGAAFAAP